MAGIHHLLQAQMEEQQQQHQHQHQQQRFIVENSSTPFLPNNYHQLQPHLHHYLPYTQQFLQHPHYNRSMFELHQRAPDPSPSPSPNPDYSGCVYGYGQEDSLFRGSARYCPKPTPTLSYSWQNQQDSAIKQPFWKPVNSNVSKQYSDESENNKQDKEVVYGEEEKEEENKGRVSFGELEAIYKADMSSMNHGIASESVVTADDLPASLPVKTTQNDDSNVVATATEGGGGDMGSESTAVSVGGRQKRKRSSKKAKEAWMARLFESLVKKLVDHQEDLQRRFMETIERLDRERKEREEAWREQESAKIRREAAAAAHQRALASTREAALVSYLQKLTGQAINFPPHDDDKAKSRWPQPEVETLVQIRTRLEPKFQDPSAQKGLLWEEVSSSMASMGFHKSARRCKDKWDNMHKGHKKSPQYGINVSEGEKGETKNVREDQILMKEGFIHQNPDK